jgi:hypothetical protein
VTLVTPAIVITVAISCTSSNQCTTALIIQVSSWQQACVEQLPDVSVPYVQRQVAGRGWTCLSVTLVTPWHPPGHMH